MAGHDRADRDLLDAGRIKLAQLGHGMQVGAGLGEDLAGLGRDGILQKAATDEVLVHLVLLVAHAVGHALGGTAVDLADDDVLGHVHQTAGQVTRVSGTQRRVGQTLAGAVGGNEVLQNGQALAEVRLNRTVDDFALRVGHQAAHTGELANLLDVASGTGEGHHVDGVELVEVLRHGLANFLVGIVPDVDDLLVALLVGHEAHLVVLVDGGDALIGLGENRRLGRRDGGVVHRHGNTGARGVVETGVLQTIENRRHLGQVVGVGDVLDQAADLLLVHLIVQEGIVRRQHIVEDDAADRGLDALAFLVVLEHAEGGGHLRVVGQTHLDLGLQVQIGAGVVGVQGVIEIDEHATLAGEAVAHGRQVVQADDHVLGRHGQRMAVGRGLDVVGGQHQHAGLGLSLGAQRHVHSHLVAVEVGVEGGADERMQLDGLALDEHRLEGLDAQTVQGWCAVQQHRMVDDDLFQHVPHVAGTAIDGTLGGLDVGGVLKLDQALHDEGLEQLQRHLLRQAALVQLQRRADDDNGTAGVVDALAEQVLAEAALLALEHIGDGLQRTVAGAGHGATATAVVEQRVHGLLQHALLVVDDDLGSTEVEQALQAVVAVDDAAVQIVQIRRGEAAAVELHHGAQIGRNNRDDVQDHVGRLVVRLEERIHHFQALHGLGTLLALARGDDLAQLFRGRLQIHGVQKVAHRLGAHAAGEVVAVVRAHLAVEGLVADELLRLDLQEGVERVLAQGLALVELLVDVGDLLFHLFGGEALVVIEIVDEVVLLRHVVGGQLAGGLDKAVALGVQLFHIGGKLVAQVVDVLLAGLFIHRGDDGAGEVQNLLKLLRRNVQKVAQTRRGALEVPDVAHGRGQLDVAHALAAHLGAGDLHAAALADDALEANALVLAAGALPVLGGTEDLLAVQAVLLRLQGTVVDGLGLLYLAARPAAHVLGGSERNAQGVEVVDVEFRHGVRPPLRHR